ncbi:MAG TPA: AMP-binding protein, partial [Chitinophaga sp.]|uniref:AMP-binding protein n=1 Tax=Chitinophaga sp. TaxID=1869181 RepID=UPI002F9420B2
MLKNEAHTGITFISGSQQETFVPYKLLYAQALSCLGYLQQQGMQPGNELVLQVDDNHTFLVSFWAALMGGIRPVPLAVAHYTESNQKLCRIWKILNHPYLLTNRRVHTNLEKSADDPAMNMQEILSGGRLLLFEDMMQHEREGNIHMPAADDIAFIQFSSGSTGTPKGVTLSHHNVITNVSAIISAGAITRADATCSWMPLTHDMGLIGFHLVPLVLGAQQYMLPTDLYIRRPALWLQVLSAHKATLTSSPNFGYKHLLQRLDVNALKDIDLSSVRLIFNGAEPISMDLCRTFLAAMQPYGLHPDVMFTVYGLAEATLAVAFPPPARPLTGIRLSRLRLGVG